MKLYAAHLISLNQLIEKLYGNFKKKKVMEEVNLSKKIISIDGHYTLYNIIIIVYSS